MKYSDIVEYSRVYLRHNAGYSDPHSGRTTRGEGLIAGRRGDRAADGANGSLSMAISMAQLSNCLLLKNDF